MCVVPALAGLATGGAAAAGATAGAITVGSVLSTAGTIIGIAAPIMQGIQARNAAEAQIADLEAQKRQQIQLNAIEADRVGRQFQGQIAQQRGQLAERGVTLDSPTALFLGQTAAEELAFATQSVRQTGYSQQAELTSSQRALDARGRQAQLKGGLSAAGRLLASGPDLWPELLS